MALLCIALSVGAGMVTFAMGGPGRCADARALWGEACDAAEGEPGENPHATVTLGAELVERMIDGVVDDLTEPMRAAIGSIPTPLGVPVPIQLDAMATNERVAVGADRRPEVGFDLELRMTARAVAFEAGCIARVHAQVPLEIRDSDSGPVLGVQSSGVELSEAEIEPVGAGSSVALLAQLVQERLRDLLGDPAIHALGELELARLGAFGIGDTALSLEPSGVAAHPDGSVSLLFVSNAAWPGDSSFIAEVHDGEGATLALTEEAALRMAMQALLGGDGLSFDTRGRRGGSLRVVPVRLDITDGAFRAEYEVHRTSSPCASLVLRLQGAVRHDPGAGELIVEVSEHQLVDSNRSRAATSRAVPSPDQLGESLTELLRDVLAVRPVRFVGGEELEFVPSDVRFGDGVIFIDGGVR